MTPVPVVTLLCRHCSRPFKTEKIRVLCPLCAHHWPGDDAGEMSGS